MRIKAIDAERKWCPFARALMEASTAIAVNRVAGSNRDTDCLCITDECMAWQWIDPFKTDDDDLGRCGLTNP